MRVTAVVKARTEQRILDAAERHFRAKGFDATSTRAIAIGAGVAAGTVFNYFASKEEIAVALLTRELAAAEDPRTRRDGEASLAEALFGLIAGQLRSLESHEAVVAGALGSLVAEGAALPHVDEAATLLREHGWDPDASPITMHLYRTLHAGVLSFWLRDDSPRREDTLALLDRVTQLFVESLGPARAEGDPR
jgi:AcrR family transcriptional regulator